MPFPAESAPDGATFYMHHYIYAVPLALIGVAVVWDTYREMQPFIVTNLLVLGWIGFVFGWNTSPVIGAVMALLGSGLPVVIIGAELLLDRVLERDVVMNYSPWAAYHLGWTAWVVAWSLFAFDDAISHAFGVWTPLNWIWDVYLLPHVVH